MQVRVGCFYLWSKFCNTHLFLNSNSTLNFAGEDCKKKWKFIRDGYNRFKKKHKIGIGSAAPKNSKNKRHQQLSFLDSVSHHRSGGSNIPASPQELTDNVETFHLGFEEQEGSTNVNFSDNNENQNGDEATEVNKTRETVKDKPGKQMKKVKRLQRHREDYILKMWKQRDENKQTLFKTIVNRKDDDVDYFCSHIAEVLRNLPPVEKAEAKKHLSAVLSDYEIMAAKKKSERQSSSSP